MLHLGVEFTGSLEDQTAQIDINGAQIKGGNITLSASANDAYIWDTGSGAADAALGFLDNLAVFIDMSFSKADAIINLDSGATIDAQGTVDINSFANSDSTMKVLSPAFALAYGEADSLAQVNVNNASITASGDITVSSQADTKLDVAAAAIHNGFNPLLAGASKYIDLAIAIADGSIDSKVIVGADSSLKSTSGSVALAANGSKDVKVGSKGAAYFDGTAGAAITASLFTSNIEARVDGRLESLTEAVSINSILTTIDNSAAASAGSGTGYVGAVFMALSPDTYMMAAVGSLITKSLPKSPSGSTAPKFGLAASYLHFDQNNTVRAGVGASGVVKAKNSFRINAVARDGITYRAGASVDGAFPGADDKAKDFALSAAVANVHLDNKAEAFIDDNAKVDVASGYIDVIAKSLIPITWEAWNFADVTDFKTGVDSVLDILTDPTLSTLTGITHSSAESEKLALSGSFNFLSIDNRAKAWIGDNAKINKDVGTTVTTAHDVSVRAIAKQETINNQLVRSTYWWPTQYV